MSRVPFCVVIPARFASTRLPGKALADISGKPMVVHVAERARASGALRVTVATDDDRVIEAVERHGFEALKTRPDHPSGTDRIAEVLPRLGMHGEDIVVNVQGDEPLIDPGLIRAVAAVIADAPGAAMATACHPVRDASEMFNPNIVKVVLDHEGYARYFSRAPIPWARDAFLHSTGTLPPGLPCYRHIGIYAYRSHFLMAFPRLSPSPLERFEALEQLRALWHGYSIAVTVRPEAEHPGVDTPEDLERIRCVFDQDARKQ